MVVQKLCACGGASPNTRFLHNFHILGPTSDANFPHFPHVSDHCTKNLGFFGGKSWFFTGCSLLTQNFLRFSTFLTPFLQETWVFTGFVLFRLGFAQDVSSSDAKFPMFFQGLPFLMQNFLHFCSSDARFPFFHHFWPYRTKNVLGFFHRIFHLLMQIFPHPAFLAPLCQKLLGCHRIFLFFSCFSTFSALLHQESSSFTGCFLFWCNIYHMRKQTSKHTHTMVPTESVKIYRYSDPKQFLSVKLFFTYFKISQPESIYVRLIFTYSEITAQNKNVCM